MSEKAVNMKGKPAELLLKTTKIITRKSDFLKVKHKETREGSRHLYRQKKFDLICLQKLQDVILLFKYKEDILQMC